MKYLIAIILLVTVNVQISTAQKTRKSEGSRKKTITIKTKVYCDHCVKCESCKARVESKVYELKGIRTVEMDAKKETIMVIYNPKFASPQQIREQVASTGYDADDVKATKEQVADLDGCCQKQN